MSVDTESLVRQRPSGIYLGQGDKKAKTPLPVFYFTNVSLWINSWILSETFCDLWIIRFCLWSEIFWWTYLAAAANSAVGATVLIAFSLNDGKPCGKHDRNLKFVIVSCVHVKKVTQPPHCFTHLMFSLYKKNTVLRSPGLNVVVHSTSWGYQGDCIYQPDIVCVSANRLQVNIISTINQTKLRDISTEWWFDH